MRGTSLFSKVSRRWTDLVIKSMTASLISETLNHKYINHEKRA